MIVQSLFGEYRGRSRAGFCQRPNGVADVVENIEHPRHSVEYFALPFLVMSTLSLSVLHEERSYEQAARRVKPTIDKGAPGVAARGEGR